MMQNARSKSCSPRSRKSGQRSLCRAPSLLTRRRSPSTRSNPYATNSRSYAAPRSHWYVPGYGTIRSARGHRLAQTCVVARSASRAAPARIAPRNPTVDRRDLTSSFLSLHRQYPATYVAQPVSPAQGGHEDQASAKTMQQGLPVATTSPVAVSAPVAGSTRKVTIVSLS